MEIDEIVDYATKSPENTNPAVLRSMLSQLNGGGSGDVFWVTFKWDANAGKVVSDKTAEEIYNAAMAGQCVRGKNVSEYGIECLELHSTIYYNDGYTADFTYASYDAIQGESGHGYGAEYLIAPPLDHVTVAHWTWEVQDDS